MGYNGRKLRVCPPQGRQLKDIREEDLFEDFRICNTYRGGGGYDMFPSIARKRGLIHDWTRGDVGTQFVVQLFGCHLRCPYCYVTKDGIFGAYVNHRVGELLDAYGRAQEKHNVGVFHMMGGAPMLWVEDWYPIPVHLFPYHIFHSDLLLTEKPYDSRMLYNIATSNTLYAINIKGVTARDYKENTGKPLDWKLFWDNFDKVVESKMNFYLTFTNPNMDYYDNFVENLAKRYGEWVLNDQFIIGLKNYDALEGGEAW